MCGFKSAVNWQAGIKLPVNSHSFPDCHERWKGTKKIGRQRKGKREREREKKKEETRTYRRQARNALHDTFKSPPNCFNPLTGGDETAFETATSLFLTTRYLNSPRLRFSPRCIRILKHISGLSHEEFREQRADAQQYDIRMVYCRVFYRAATR